jgi:hypothetical protein
MACAVPLREFWRDVKTDEVWAVELEDGRPVACAGPLASGIVLADPEACLLDELEYSPAGIRRLLRRGDRLVAWEPRAVDVSPT